MQNLSADRWGIREDDYMKVESVRDDGEVIIRFTGGHRLRLAVPPSLVSHYRRLHDSGRSA
jgi:hypothetical protein